MKKFFLLLIAISILLMSCSVFSPVKTEPSTAYVLNTLPTPPIKKSSRGMTLLVTPPETNPLYRTREMAYTTAPYKIAYFAKNVWAERPSEMIYPLLIQTLQHTKHFHAVVNTSNSVNYDYVLNTQIQQLLQDYRGPIGYLHLTVRAELIRAATQRVVAIKEISIVESFQPKIPSSGVRAANQATARMLQQLALFTVRTI